MKKPLNYPDQINLLCAPGTRLMLVAIAYHRGDGGRYAEPARDFLADGIAAYLAKLSKTERARVDEILATVKTSETLRTAIKKGNLSG